MVIDPRTEHGMMIVMRYPEHHKEEMRERIVRAASAALRRDGLGGVSIPALMKQAGLTHGGFYGYFRDRSELAAAAVLSAALDTAQGAFGDDLSLDETLLRYLSEGHLAHPEAGCVVAALGTEGDRQPPPVRRAFAEVARGLIRLVDKKLHPGRTSRGVSDEALRLAATMVGAVVLGRLVDDPALARRILHAARESANP
jgi:TetR/AcrR family transcriptional regulator, transcriptional repressor for nem operon